MPHCVLAMRLKEWMKWSCDFSVCESKGAVPFYFSLLQLWRSHLKRITSSQSMLYIFQITALQEETHEKDSTQIIRNWRFNVTQCCISGSQFLSQRYSFEFSLGEMKITRRKAQVYYKIMPHRTSNRNLIKESRPLKRAFQHSSAIINRN